MRMGSMPVLALAAGLAAGCAGSRNRAGGTTDPQRTVVTTTGMVGPDGRSADTDAEPVLRNRVLQSLPQLKTIGFDFDKAELRADARAILDENASYLKAHAEATALVAGHCDVRGTTAYNLALGQKRAKAVREYYRRLGVPGNRIATISYGLEHPLCKETTEECHAQNRRAETLATYPADVSGLPAQEHSVAQ